MADQKQMLTHAEIVKAVQKIRYSSKRTRNQRRSPSIHGLAVTAGLERKTIYNVAQSGNMLPETADKLRYALSQAQTCVDQV